MVPGHDGTAVFIELISGTRPHTGLLPGTTRTRARLGVVPRSMAHTVALEVGLPTTREQEHMLAGALSMGHTDPEGKWRRYSYPWPKWK